MQKIFEGKAAAILVLLVAFTAFGTTQAGALEDTIQISVADVMAKPEIQQALYNSVKFFFGNTPHPAVLHEFKKFTTNKKAKSRDDSIAGACEHAFLSALQQFQKRAKNIGANAVVDIHSYYRHQETSSDTSVECHTDFGKVRVVLIGDFVQVANP